jgi:hypothetical protein
MSGYVVFAENDRPIWETFDERREKALYKVVKPLCWDFDPDEERVKDRWVDLRRKGYFIEYVEITLMVGCRACQVLKNESDINKTDYEECFTCKTRRLTHANQLADRKDPHEAECEGKVLVYSQALKEYLTHLVACPANPDAMDKMRGRLGIDKSVWP